MDERAHRRAYRQADEQQMDRQTNRQMTGLTDGRTDREADRLAGGRRDGQSDGQTNRHMKGLTDGCTDREEDRLNRQTNMQIGRHTDRQVNGLTDRLPDRQTNTVSLTSTGWADTGALCSWFLYDLVRSRLYDVTPARVAAREKSGRDGTGALGRRHCNGVTGHSWRACPRNESSAASPASFLPSFVVSNIVRILAPVALSLQGPQGLV